MLKSGRHELQSICGRVFVALPLLVLLGCGMKNREERAMTPQDSLKAMHIQGDLHVELFVSEPDVISPVEMAFEETGKIYVAEMLDYPDDLPAGRPERSRIRLLGEMDGDGKIDRCPIFADNVLTMSGYLPWKGGLIVTLGQATGMGLINRHVLCEP